MARNPSWLRACAREQNAFVLFGVLDAFVVNLFFVSLRSLRLCGAFPLL
jgi:hypothetical protein